MTVLCLRRPTVASLLVLLLACGFAAASGGHGTVAETPKAEPSAAPHEAPAAKPAPAPAPAPPRASKAKGAPAPAPVAAAAEAPKDDGPSAAALWGELADGNRRFVRGSNTPREFTYRRQELAKGQSPKVAVLGCADSRVPPEIVFDRGLGELFVVRTAGQVADRVALGSLEYAVEHLGTRMIVVLGHEKCGAVAAAAAGGEIKSENLREVVDEISPALERLKDVVGDKGMVHMGVELNVHRAAQKMLERSEVLREAVAAGHLTIVKAVYRLDTGEVGLLE